MWQQNGTSNGVVSELSKYGIHSKKNKAGIHFLDKADFPI